MKISFKGLGPARKNLDDRKKRMKGQRVAWQASAKILERQYIRKWFKSSGALTMPGGGPEDDPWPGLTSDAYIAHKLREGKNIKGEFDGTMRLSYYAKAMTSGKGMYTGVRDTDRGKLYGLTKLGFTLMTLEDSKRKQIFKLVSHYLATGKLR